MEKIYATRDGNIRVTWTGDDLSKIWAEISEDNAYQNGDYYKPGKTRARVLASYFGNFHTTLPI